mmetsp:Transcript_5192/g.7647  ORF Transcript_5192/g.7647 Transcript_5192/m.7647 type:complete len:109 (+) Transcript_5192:123-449(+)
MSTFTSTTMRTTVDKRGGDNNPNDPQEVSADLMNAVLPPDIFKRTFQMLPVFHRCLSPVGWRCRTLDRDRYLGKQSNETNRDGDILTKEERTRTYLYCLAMEDARACY